MAITSGTDNAMSSSLSETVSFSCDCHIQRYTVITNSLKPLFTAYNDPELSVTKQESIFTSGSSLSSLSSTSIALL